MSSPSPCKDIMVKASQDRAINKEILINTVSLLKSFGSLDKLTTNFLKNVFHSISADKLCLFKNELSNFDCKHLSHVSHFS